MSFARARSGRIALGLSLFAALALSVPASTQSSNQNSGIRRRTQIGGREVADGEVLVKYRAGRAAMRQAQLELVLDADESEDVGRRGLKRMHSRRLDTEQLLAALQNDPDIEYAEPNYALYSTITPNDTQFAALWGLFNTGLNTVGGGGTAGADIDILSAWDITTGSRSNVVGVIDTGVDYNHPDLAANIWSAPAQFQVTVGGQTITCAAGTHGFNAINRTCNPMDDQYHGTHVSGTIGALGNNGAGVVGVNWLASIMGLKFLGSNGSGWTSDAVLAIEFAIQAKSTFGSAANVRVLSNSWGGGGGQALLDAINAANAADMLFVAAAGNANTNIDVSPTYPAAYTAPNMLTIESTDNRDQRSSFSNYGATKVHLGAPGSSIYSTMPNNSYGTLSGTSMATPHASGAAMMALAMCTLSTSSLKTLLMNNVDPVGALAGTTVTGGRLNVVRSLQNCAQPRVTNVTFSADKAAPQLPNTTVTFTASVTGGQSPYSYKWVLFDGTSYITLADWNSSNTLVWTPAVVNTAYAMSVRVRSAWNTGSAEFTTGWQAFPIQNRASSVALSANLAAPQATGTTVTWTASASGGQAPYQYRWFVHDGTTLTAVTDWVSSNTFAWTPAVANDSYGVVARARSANSTGSAEASSSTAAFAIKPRVTGVALTPDKSSPQFIGTTVTWTAAPSGGTAPYEYKWMLYDGTSYTTLVDWDTANTYAWTPNAYSSNSSISVRVRSAWNAGGPAEFITPNQPFVIQPKVASIALAANLVAPQAVGTTVTWTATPSGGLAPYQYRWFVSDGTTLTAVTDWVASNTFAWVPSVANANYAVVARARSAGSTGSAEASSPSQAFAIKPKVTGVSLSTDKVSPQYAGTTVTWTATPSGGEAPYDYKWMLYDGTSYTTLQDWTASNTFAWTPNSYGSNYSVSVRVRSAWNAGAAEFVTANQPFVITPKVASVALAANLTAPQGLGATVTWAATPSGGLAPYQYRWFVSDGTTLAPVSDWVSSNTFAWTPVVANANYAVVARARSAGSTGSAEASSPTTAFAIMPKVTGVALTADVAAPQSVGATITWTAVPTGGQGPYEYKWMVHNGTSYTTAVDWTSSNTFAWTPNAANANVSVSVRVRSAWNVGGAAEFITPNQPFPIQP